MISNNDVDDWGKSNEHDDPNSVTTGIDMMQVAMRRKGLIALGMFVGICLSVLYYAQADPIYESVAMLSIEENNPTMAIDKVSGVVENSTAAEDHAIRLASAVIIQRALEMDAPSSDGQLIELPTLAGSEQPVQDIFEALTVAPVQDGSEILTLSYRGKNPEETGEILGTLIAAYTEYLTGNRGQIETNIVSWIKKAKEDIDAELVELNDKLVDLRYKESDVIYMGNGDEIILPQQAQLRLTEEADKLEETLAEISRQISELERLLEADKRPDFDLDYGAVLRAFVQSDLNMTSNQREYAEIQWDIEQFRTAARNNERVLPLRMKDRELAQRLGPDHPLRVALREQIEEAEGFRDESGDGQRQALTGRDAERFEVEQYLSALKMSFTLTTKDLNAVKTKLAAKEKATKIIQKNSVEKARLEADILRKEEFYQSVVANLKDANLVQEYGNENKIRVTTLQHAGIGEKVAPSIAKCLAAGSLLGFMAGFGLGYLVEMFDKTFRSPQEVSKTLQLPMIGHIPEIQVEPIDGSKLSEVLIAHHKPKSPLSENFRAIRTALYFSTSGGQHRVIQTTSPVPGDGKSTLTANLAVTIAQSNKRVLLLDADFRRPTMHKLFGTTNHVGLASVVAGEASPEHAIQETEVPNLSVMACGPRPDNPSELLTSPEFESLIKVLREQYDFVLIDTPPVLAVTDPGIVSARVDGVIMALRIRKNGRPSAVRARKILTDLDANILGIVVNGIDHRSGSYGYYSSYRRGYGYGYGYKYGYGQDKTEQLIGKYFEEPKPELAGPQEVGATAPGRDV